MGAMAFCAIWMKRKTVQLPFAQRVDRNTVRKDRRKIEHGNVK